MAFLVIIPGVAIFVIAYMRNKARYKREHGDW